MATIAQKLRAEQNAQTDRSAPVKSVSRTSGGDLFTRANGIDTIAVLNKLGIEHWTTNRGEFFVCPGCGERDSMVCDGGGGKCFHDRCTEVGVKDKRGFRTNTELAAAASNCESIDAAKWLVKEFGLEKPLPTSGQNDHKSTEWLVRLPDEIFAPLEAPDYLIDGIIRRGGLLEIQAYGGSGKSWLAVNLALCVATGSRWLGRFETKRSTVAIVDYENGFYEEARRLQANAKALGLPFPVAGIGLITMPDLYMVSDGFEKAIEKLAGNYGVVIIDTLKAASPGVDENDSKMREGLDRLRRVGERTGCTFTVLIHSKKKSNSATEIDPRERGRGSSAIYDAADAQLGVEYTDGEPLRVQQTKARSGRYVEPFEVRISDGDDGAVHVIATDTAKPASKALDDFENVVCVAVLEALRANPGSSLSLLTEKCGRRKTTVAAALEQLQRNGAAKNAGTDKAGRWFAT